MESDRTADIAHKVELLNARQSGTLSDSRSEPISFGVRQSDRHNTAVSTSYLCCKDRSKPSGFERKFGELEGESSPAF
jgi:hypothetical protein